MGMLKRDNGKKKRDDGQKKKDDMANRSKSAATPAAAPGMNRQMKRMMAKREGAADRLRRPSPKSRAKKKRTKPLVFLKEVRQEMGRVSWASRSEVITYTIVVLVSVAFFMIFIAGADFVSLEAVQRLLDLTKN